MSTKRQIEDALVALHDDAVQHKAEIDALFRQLAELEAAEKAAAAAEGQAEVERLQKLDALRLMIRGYRRSQQIG